MNLTAWFGNAIVYHVLIDRFAGYSPAADPLEPDFMGGNLAALTDKLPYLEELGINTLWISPFCRTSTYHGYHVTDYFEIEPRFGSSRDLKKLIDDAHSSGIKVIADFVPNHCSVHHPFFEEAKSDRRSKYFEWFYFEKWPDDYLCFLDVRELPKLNLDWKETRDHIIGAAKHWLSFGLDGFRLDHVIGPSHSFWRIFKREIKRDFPAAVLIGEAWLEGISWKYLKTLKVRNKYLRWILGVSQENVQREYRGELDGVLDFRFRQILISHMAKSSSPNVESLANLLKSRTSRHGENYFLPTFLDNHDTNRFLFECDNDRSRLEAAATIQFSMRQPPVIYYGTEVGMTHEHPVNVLTPHSDLQTRQPMIWDRRDEELFDFYRRLIGKRKNRAMMVKI